MPLYTRDAVHCQYMLFIRHGDEGVRIMLTDVGKTTNKGLDHLAGPVCLMDWHSICVDYTGTHLIKHRRPERARIDKEFKERWAALEQEKRGEK